MLIKTSITVADVTPTIVYPGIIAIEYKTALRSIVTVSNFVEVRESKDA